MSLIRHVVPESEGILNTPAPSGVLAIPRTDNSTFIINTTSQEMAIDLRRPAQDRLCAARVSGKTPLKAYEVLWLE